MARLLVTNDAGTYAAEITEGDGGYGWACSCGQGDAARRKDDAIEHAGQHVDTTHLN